MQATSPELSGFLRDKFALHLPDTISEQELLLMLEKRLGQLLEKNPEEFFQLLYRIDIPEHRLKQVLEKEDALAQLAAMVYQRQLQKIKTRSELKNSFSIHPDDKDLQW